MGSRPLAPWVAALLLVSACQEGVEVIVTQDGGHTTFAAAPARASFKACVERVYVYAEQPGGPQQIWYATRGSAREPCIRAVRFAADPTGFSAKSPPTLETGKRYRVGMTGNGFAASATFTAR